MGPLLPPLSCASDYTRLERTIAEALRLLGERPPHRPTPTERPRFTAPKLAPRGVPVATGDD